MKTLPMKKASLAKTSDDLHPEYRFGYRKARPDRFAVRLDKDCLMVVLDPDIAQMPHMTRRKTERLSTGREKNPRSSVPLSL